MTNKKIIVADAGPLIAFGRIQFLETLKQLVGTIVVPKAVVAECLVDIQKPGASQIRQAMLRKHIQIHQPMPSERIDRLHRLLGEGEATAIELALQLKVGLLIDEKLGRKTAQKLQISVIGTAGILLLAKRKKLIAKVMPLVRQLHDMQYYFSKELIKEIAKLSNEKIPKN